MFLKHSIKITKYMRVNIEILSQNGVKYQAVYEYERFLHNVV
jgi:hypothetical protein